MIKPLRRPFLYIMLNCREGRCKRCPGYLEYTSSGRLVKLRCECPHHGGSK